MGLNIDVLSMGEIVASGGAETKTSEVGEQFITSPDIRGDGRSNG